MRFVFMSKEIFYIFLFGLSIIYISLTSGCSNPMPSVDVTIWAGDSIQQGIVRSQQNQVLECKEPQFDQYACLTYQDMKKLYAALLQCKEWGPPIASQSQMSFLIKKNQEVIHHVLQGTR